MWETKINIEVYVCTDGWCDGDISVVKAGLYVSKRDSKQDIIYQFWILWEAPVENYLITDALFC